MLRLVQARTLARASTSYACRQLHASLKRDALSKFAMPAMSPTMTEGGIATWKKKEGETFAPGDVLLEIETDKATMDVEAQDEGILLKIVKADGSKAVQVGTTVAIVGEEGDEADEAEISKLTSEDSGSKKEEAPKEEKKEEPKKEEKKEEKPKEEKEEKEPKKEEGGKKESSSPAPPKKSSEQPSADRPIIFASPVAKRLAQEKGIPLASLKGTGPEGRIIKADIENFKPAAAASSSTASAPAAAAAVAAAPAGTAAYTDTPISGMRRTIASRLTESKSGTPHYYLTVEINMERVNKLREVFNAAAKAAEAAGGLKDGVKGGTKLSVNDFIVKASALALQDVPEVNSGWHGDFIRQYTAQDIAIAVATPTGLITPILRNSGVKGLATLSSESKSLAGKARDGKQIGRAHV